MSYERYKTIRSKPEFFSDWDKENLNQIDGSMKQHIYTKYLLKCAVFQRDDFRCQNKTCSHPYSELTLHHIRFRKNNGKDTPKNCSTVCQSCHKAYHRGKRPLTINGYTYRLNPKDNIVNWKEEKKSSRVIRKDNKRFCGISISWELWLILMRFMEKEYTELYDD